MNSTAKRLGHKLGTLDLDDDEGKLLFKLMGLEDDDDVEGFSMDKASADLAQHRRLAIDEAVNQWTNRRAPEPSSFYYNKIGF